MNTRKMNTITRLERMETRDPESRTRERVTFSPQSTLERGLYVDSSTWSSARETSVNRSWYRGKASMKAETLPFRKTAPV